MKERPKSAGIKERRTDHRLPEAVITVLQALFIVLVTRSFLFQPFNIPSGSMEPTLLVGDDLFVSKFSYGFGRYSLPFSPPLFSGRVLAAWPDRGDIVVFRRGADDFIKRLIGRPGDRIQLVDGVIFINGTPVERHRIADFVGRDPCRPAPPDSLPVRVTQWQETLPNGVSYRTLQCSSRAAFPDDTGTYIVPPGHFFMMGDNRENSEDSRFRDVGFVPFENLIARAQLVFFSIDVRDAKRPRAVNYLAAPPNTWNIHLQTHDDLLLVVNAKYIFAAAEFADEKAYYKGQLGNVVGTAERTSAARDWTAGLAVYDISKPATPQRIGCWLMTSGTPGLSAARGLPNDIAGQAELAWQNVMNLLAKGRHGCGRYC